MVGRVVIGVLQQGGQGLPLGRLKLRQGLPLILLKSLQVAQGIASSQPGLI